MNVEVIVVGAGIVGAACAAALSARGCKVTVIESSIIGGGATAAGMGHLLVLDDIPAELALTAYGCRLWHELAHQAPEVHEYRQCGTIWVARDSEEMAEAERKHQRLHEAGIATRVLSASELQTMEPNLADSLLGGLLVEQDGLVYPPRSAAWLMEQAQVNGASVLKAEVRKLGDGRLELNDGQTLHADFIVVAAGYASKALVPDIPLRAKKGQLAITDRYPGYAQHQLVELGYVKSAHLSAGTSVAFNVQARPTGQLLIGSSREFDQDSKQLNQELLGKMLARACEYLPSLSRLNILRCWTGVRAVTPDGQPLLGPHPSLPSILLACGHEGLGITTALASAQLICAQVFEEPAQIPSTPYLPQRYMQGIAA